MFRRVARWIALRKNDATVQQAIPTEARSSSVEDAFQDDPWASRPRPAEINWGELRRVTPVSEHWGFDRGSPVDRYFIERFLHRHRSDIRGRVLEVQNDAYTTRFGSGVTRRDVLDIDRSNPRATIVADLTKADSVPAGTFDAFILTQTLHEIYDIRAAMAHTRRILAPGGVLLCTLPSVTRVDLGDAADWRGQPDSWRFTESSVNRLLDDCFPGDERQVLVYGNVLTCTAFLYGISWRELTREELDAHDPRFPLIVCARVVKRT